MKLWKVDFSNLLSIEPSVFRSSETSACLNDLNGKTILILNLMSKSMNDLCQSNQKRFTKSFERVLRKFSSMTESFPRNNFYSYDLKIPKIDASFFSKDSQRNPEFRAANLFYRELARKFENIKKLFASFVDLSNRLNETLQEITSYMDETCSRSSSDSTDDSEKPTLCSSNSLHDHASLFQRKDTLPQIHQDEIMDLKFIRLPPSKAQCLLSCSKDKSIKVLDLETKAVKHAISGLPHHINQVLYSEETQTLAASLSNDIVRLWHYGSDFAHIADLKAHSDIVWGLQFIENGNKLLSSSFDSTVRCWDLDKCKPEYKISVREGKVYGLVHLPEKKLISAAGQNSIFFFDERDTKSSVFSFKKAHENQITKLDCCQGTNSSRLASCGKDNKVKLWDLNKAEAVQEYQHEDYVYGMKFAKGRKLLASASDDKTMRVWSLDDGVEVHNFKDHSDFVKTCEWDSESKILASAGKDKKVVLRYLC